MAEYTIPKPYRDFYVTDPYIATQKEVEELQEYSCPRSQVEYGSILHGENTLPDKEIPVKVESKNLIVYPYTTSERTVNGVTFSAQSDGGILCSGTPTGNASMTCQTISVSKDTIYTFSASGTYSNVSCYADVYDSSNNHVKTFFPNSGIVDLSSYSDVSKMIIGIAIGSVDTEVSGTIYPQVEKGDTATSYALYQPEGTPVTVTTCGKNLLNVPEFCEVAQKIDKPIRSLKKGNTYTIKAQSVTTDGSSTPCISFYDSNGLLLKYVAITTNTTNFTLGSNDPASFVIWADGYSPETSRGKNATITNLMIENGYDSTSYESYRETVIETAIGKEIACTQLNDNTNIFTDNKGVSLSGRFVLSNEELFHDKLTAIIGVFANRPTDITDYDRLYIATDKTDTSRSTILPAGKSGATASNWIYI